MNDDNQAPPPKIVCSHQQNLPSRILSAFNNPSDKPF